MMDKDKMSKEELKLNTLKKAESIIQSLQKAYSHRPENMSFHEEKKMLEIMVAAKKLAESVQNVFSKLDTHAKQKPKEDQK